MPSLYRRLLGAEFDAMPAVLRQFHDAPGGCRARGSLRIERPSGILRNAMCRIIGLPRPGSDVPVRLEVVVEGDRERWVRELQGRRLETVEWAEGTVLMERSGPIVYSCILRVDGRFLHYEFQRAWFAGLPLPRALSPFVESYVEAEERRWKVLVRLFLPLLGEIMRYEGWVEPE